MVKKQTVEKPATERSDSLYRGVRKRKWGKYVSEIRLPNSRQRIWLGSYDTAEKAARAFDAAMFCLRGTAGRFNFPNDPPNIAGGSSMTRSQIQTAAARFANSELPKDSSEQPELTTSACSGQPVLTPLDSFSSSSEDTVSLSMESPSPPLSEVSQVTEQTESDVNGSFPDLFFSFGSGNFGPDESIFAGFNYFNEEFYVPELSIFDYAEENLDGLIIEDPFLWTF